MQRFDNRNLFIARSLKFWIYCSKRIADIFGASFPRRLMVLEEDLTRARRIALDICPEFLEPLKD
jgi:hypothetical protein